MSKAESGGGLGLIWGVKAIAAEIDQSERQTYHLLENGRIPAKKVGGRWCASRKGLADFFNPDLRGEIAESEAA